MGRIKVVGDGKKGSKRSQIDGVESTVERFEMFVIENDSRRRGRVMKAVSGQMPAEKDATSLVESKGGE